MNDLFNDSLEELGSNVCQAFQTWGESLTIAFPQAGLEPEGSDALAALIGAVQAWENLGDHWLSLQRDFTTDFLPTVELEQEQHAGILPAGTVQRPVVRQESNRSWQDSSSTLPAGSNARKHSLEEHRNGDRTGNQLVRQQAHITPVSNTDESSLITENTAAWSNSNQFLPDPVTLPFGNGLSSQELRSYSKNRPPTPNAGGAKPQSPPVLEDLGDKCVSPASAKNNSGDAPSGQSTYIKTFSAIPESPTRELSMSRSSTVSLTESLQEDEHDKTKIGETISSTPGGLQDFANLLQALPVEGLVWHDQSDAVDDELGDDAIDRFADDAIYTAGNSAKSGSDAVNVVSHSATQMKQVRSWQSSELPEEESLDNDAMHFLDTRRENISRKNKHRNGTRKNTERGNIHQPVSTKKLVKAEVSPCTEEIETEQFGEESTDNPDVQLPIFLQTDSIALTVPLASASSQSFTLPTHDLDLDLILEAVQQEINRDYRRFYGG